MVVTKAQSEGIYSSTFKTDFTWPGQEGSGRPEAEKAGYPDLCGWGERFCDCGHTICACPQAVRPSPVEPKDEMVDWKYLEGVKTLYQDSFNTSLPGRR